MRRFRRRHGRRQRERQAARGLVGSRPLRSCSRRAGVAAQQGRAARRASARQPASASCQAARCVVARAGCDGAVEGAHARANICAAASSSSRGAACASPAQISADDAGDQADQRLARDLAGGAVAQHVCERRRGAHQPAPYRSNSPRATAAARCSARAALGRSASRQASHQLRELGDARRLRAASSAAPGGRLLDGGAPSSGLGEPHGELRLPGEQPDFAKRAAAAPRLRRAGPMERRSAGGGAAASTSAGPPRCAGRRRSPLRRPRASAAGAAASARGRRAAACCGTASSISPISVADDEPALDQAQRRRRPWQSTASEASCISARPGTAKPRTAARPSASRAASMTEAVLAGRPSSRSRPATPRLPARRQSCASRSRCDDRVAPQVPIPAGRDHAGAVARSRRQPRVGPGHPGRRRLDAWASPFSSLAILRGRHGRAAPAHARRRRRPRRRPRVFRSASRMRGAYAPRAAAPASAPAMAS